jgi:hypothetical protein
MQGRYLCESIIVIVDVWNVRTFTDTAGAAIVIVKVAIAVAWLQFFIVGHRASLPRRLCLAAHRFLQHDVE